MDIFSDIGKVKKISQENKKEGLIKLLKDCLENISISQEQKC